MSDRNAYLVARHGDTHGLQVALDTGLICLEHQVVQRVGRAGAPVQGFHQPDDQFGPALLYPTQGVAGYDALCYQVRQGDMALRSTRAPVKKVGIHPCPIRPVPKVLGDRLPHLGPVAAGHDQIGGGFACIVAKSPEERRELPPWFQFTPLGWSFPDIQQHLVAGLQRPQPDFHRVAQQSASAPVMVAL